MSPDLNCWHVSFFGTDTPQSNIPAAHSHSNFLFSLYLNANKLLITDVNIAAKGVRRIFEEWKEQGINIKITQNQYDILTSLAFNMGVEKLRTSKFIQMIKKNKLSKAAKLIKTTGVDDKFPGLESRRLIEYKKFIS